MHLHGTGRRKTEYDDSRDCCNSYANSGRYQTWRSPVSPTILIAMKEYFLPLLILQVPTYNFHKTNKNLLLQYFLQRWKGRSV